MFGGAERINKSFMKKRLPGGKRINPTLYPSLGLLVAVLFILDGSWIAGIVWYLLIFAIGPYLHYKIAWRRHENKVLNEQRAQEYARKEKNEDTNTDNVLQSDIMRSVKIFGALFVILMIVALIAR